uniref:Ubiquitin carboxyl-terminal hydrolase 37-like n=1 Tax=Hirondellea gigas TaxID=1518452 RepID=A0A6A7FZQ4_9CRUS
MKFTPKDKTPRVKTGESAAASPRAAQQLIGGCKKSVDSSENVSPTGQFLTLMKMKQQKTPVMRNSPIINKSANNENCYPSKSPINVLPTSSKHCKRTLLPFPVPSKILQKTPPLLSSAKKIFSTPSAKKILQSVNAQSNNQDTDGIWCMGSKIKSPKNIFNDDIYLNDDPKFQHSSTEKLKTYSSKASPQQKSFGTYRGSASASKLSAINHNSGDPENKLPLLGLPKHSSVTVTAISSSIPSTSQKRSSSFTPSSSNRMLKFDHIMVQSVQSQNSSAADTTDHASQVNTVKKHKREPLTPIKAKVPFSSILRGISPTKVDKCYGTGSLSSEKENVPFDTVAAEEKPIPPHLLGFPNLGNTCYLNAVLQCLLGARVFRCDVSSCAQHLPSPANTILHAMTQLLKARHSGYMHSLRQPLRLIKENIEKLDSSFIGWKMQDANEFLTKILDTVKDEVDDLLSNVNEQKDGCHNDNSHSTGENDPFSSNQSFGASSATVMKWSPFKDNEPKLLNNSVEIRSIYRPLNASETNGDINGVECCSSRGLKRSCPQERESETITNGDDKYPQSNLSNHTQQLTDSQELNGLDFNENLDSSRLTDENSKTLPYSKNRKHSGDGIVNKSVRFNANNNTRHSLVDIYHSGSSHNRKSKNLIINGEVSSQNRNNDSRVSLPHPENPITTNFAFQLQEEYKCLGCNASVKRSQEYFSLYVHLSAGCSEDGGGGGEGSSSSSPVGPSSIMDAVADYMKLENRELKCEHCSYPTAQVNTRFTKMPRILIIQVKRYTYNAAQYSSLKVRSSIEVSKCLDLSSYTETDADPYHVVAGETVYSAPPTPRKTTTTTAPVHSCVSAADNAVDQAGTGDATISSTDGEQGDAAKNNLTEEEQFQEALRRSLEEAADPSSSKTTTGSGAVVLDDQEEDDLQKAIRLSLKEAQEQEEQQRDEVQLQQESTEASSNSWQYEERQGEQEDDCDGPHCYKLASIVSHFGWSTNTGHYTCDVLSDVAKEWLHYDDETVTPVTLSTVLGDYRQRNGYIFFYIHRDLLNVAKR